MGGNNMKKNTLDGIVSQIKYDIGVNGDLFNYPIWDVEFNIIGSENNPHIILEEGLNFNGNGVLITSNDLRYLVYNGVEKDEIYVKKLSDKTFKQRLERLRI
jgi:hypothetical protein